MEININANRIWEEFKELTSIDSPSFHERNMADVLTKKLTDLGFEVSEDDAGTKCGGNAGNLHAFLKGSLSGEPILLSGHMDTVVPANHKEAVLLEDGRIVSKGDTVLGADDLNCVVSILQAVRILKELDLPHRDLEVLFSIAEEKHCQGSGLFDYSKMKSKEAYILDMSGTPGSAALQAPALVSFTVTIYGKAAHAGFCPEDGIHAIYLVSQAISRLQQGRVGEQKEMTFNIGKISGGMATNIVPESCTCEGEVRGYDYDKVMQKIEEVRSVFEDVVKDTNARVEMDVQVQFKSYKIEEDSPVVKRFEKACENLEIESHLTKTFGASDNNHFTAHGIEGIVLSCGMNQVHSVREYTSLQDLVLCTKLVLELVRL
jgi:tripeptide aminopeptidase